ncbi:MAG TPA: glutaredoxin family protein [Methanothrix sp.]|nr:glutaredoxin family protein [Methanothrix sp.]HOL44216.1 glutaredoxin family protein [Methanothrix sp.]
MIRIYTLKKCPMCEMLKRYMNDNGVTYEEVDMSTPDAQAELLTNGVFALSAPVLQVGDRFYKTYDLFDDLGNIRAHIRTHTQNGKLAILSNAR